MADSVAVHERPTGGCCASPCITDLSGSDHRRFYCARCGEHWFGRAAHHPFGGTLRRFTKHEWEEWVSAPIREMSGSSHKEG